jgi:3-hydroxyacyl-CoA dehydrogenase
MLSTVSAVACVGAGAIGSSWARLFARNGLDVRVYDAVAAPEIDGARTVRTLAEAVDGAAYVQESVPEQLELKQELFAELDRLAPADVVLASSASALPISRIAARVVHPERCLVVHPLNPPHVIPLVELAPGERTSAGAVEAARAFMTGIGQRPIVCRKEVFGFVANRMQMALLREALHLHRDGVASVADIDRCLTDGLALRWAVLGPFAVEHTNAPSIDENLRKFGSVIRELFASLYSGTDLLGDDDVDAIVDEVEELYSDRPHDELIRWRDRKIAELRAVVE